MKRRRRRSSSGLGYRLGTVPHCEGNRSTSPPELGREIKKSSLKGKSTCGTLQTIADLNNPPCDIPSGCCSFTGPWTVTRSYLRMLCRVAAFCQPLRPVLLLVSFPRSRSPVVGVLGLC